MSKSNYEIYAEKKQKEILNSTRTFQSAIEILKFRKAHFSAVYYESSCETVAELFDLSYDEVDQAVDGKEYWIV